MRPSRTVTRRGLVAAAAVLLATTVGFAASSNSSSAATDVAAVTTVSAVPVFDATRHDDETSRSFDRGRSCLDYDHCSPVITPTVTTSPSVQPAKVVKKLTHPPVHHKPTHKVKKTTKGKTSSTHHKSRHKVSNGPSVSSGGGGSCAPSVKLPSRIVQIVHKHLSGCKAAALLWIIKHESGGNVHARNPSSGAYGIPQALPGRKMASCGSDWRTNPDTQIRWMIGYTNRYGGPIGAYHFWKKHGWY